MRRHWIRVAIPCVIASSTVLVVAAQQSNSGQSTAQQSTATLKAQPTPMPQEKAMHPAPSNSAQQKTQKNSVGRGALTMTTAQPVDFWQEQVAYTGGNTVTTDFLYNPNVGVIYGYREDDFKCANGEPADGGILEAQYTQGNQASRPGGSLGVPLYRAVPQTSRQRCWAVCISLCSLARTHSAPHLGNYDLVGRTLAHLCDYEGNKPCNRRRPTQTHLFGA